MSAAAGKFILVPRDYKLYMTLASLAGAAGTIPDRKQPRSLEHLAELSGISDKSVARSLGHLEKHGWLARRNKHFTDGRLNYYSLAIGSACECPARTQRRPRQTGAERSARWRMNQAGLPLPGQLPAEPAGRTAVYRMFTVAGALLYIGISNNFGRRWTQHEAIQPWWPDMQNQTVHWYPTRDEALAVEKAAIKAERPKYNITHAVKPSAEQSADWDRDVDEALWTLYMERAAS